MAGGKWIEDLSATTPLDDAARRVLTVRLEVVRDALPLAIKDPFKDPEHVHQLRVSTRRATAALDIFAVCLPTKVARSARKRLRGIRRAAGAARDWDVFLAFLTDWAAHRPPAHRPGLDFLAGYAAAQRTLAQALLVQVGELYPFDFDRFLAETVAAVSRPDDDDLRTLGDLAHPWLCDLLGELERDVAGDLDDYARLHQVRIVGKRLRYAMEVFADCFAPAFRAELYPAVEEMQDILGLANDSHVAIERLIGLRDRAKALAPVGWNRLQPGITALLRHHRKRLPQERQHFLAWWAAWQKSGGEAALSALLEAEPVPA
jgi:CHAD domain-containing protein